MPACVFTSPQVVIVRIPVTNVSGSSGIGAGSHRSGPSGSDDGWVWGAVFQSSTYTLGGGEDYHDIRYMRLSNSPNQGSDVAPDAMAI